MTGWNRRNFLRTAGIAGTGLALGAAGRRNASASPTSLDRRHVATISGTTLETAANPTASQGYRRLAAGPGWPLVVRPDLVAPDPVRDDRRVPLAAFAQFTDLHLVDTQSPARFEYLHPLMGAGAFRPQETLGPLAAAHLVRKVNTLAGGPITGRALDFLMSTGDNTDNHEHVELEWFLGVLNGGRVAPNTGAPTRYEGVQDSGAESYWHPDGDVDDRYRRAGFPSVPGLLDTAIQTFTSPGLRVPWYATFGNHDGSVLGTLPDGFPAVDALYTGNRKVIGRDERDARRLAAGMRNPEQRHAANDVLASDSGTVRAVTPDENRAPFTTGEFIRAHLDPAHTGPGPVGHGFTGDNIERGAYYAFRIAPGITGVSLDTTNTVGFAEGSLGFEQYKWLERVLTRGSSRYFDALGHRRHHQVDDELFVLFSHHTSDTMAALLPDARRPGEIRIDGGTLVRLLHRFPNVLAWVNGHSHRNAITPHPSDEAERGFWEINTASHVDYPQLARVIEIADNLDGTLSLFTTLFEAESPYQVDYDDRSSAALASLYRELSFNDPHADHSQLGEHVDRNAELLVPGRLPRR